MVADACTARMRPTMTRRSPRRRYPLRQTLTSTQKGYGAAPQRLRREVKRKVDRGGVICWRCGQSIHPAEPWDLGHSDHRLAKHLGSLYAGAEHRRCSRTAGGWKRIGKTPPPPRSQPPAKALRFFDTSARRADDG